MVVEVAILPADLADDVALVDTLCRLVNGAYEFAEAGMWRHVYARTSISEMCAAIRSEQVAAARLGGRLVGSIFIRELDTQTGWFGALAVEPAYGGRGIGRELVAFAERRASAAGLIKMQLEVLTPTEADTTHSQLLAQWYGRLGYQEIARSPMEDFEPEALPFLAVPCQVVVHLKQLGAEVT